MTDDTPPVICLMGPTASGKTDLALRLVEALPCDIVSVDSAMVYRGMDIGTAKPDAATQARAPHRLIDICDPAETYSAAQFCKDARREAAEIQSQGRIPLLVGGTGLYFRAFEQGLSNLPAASHTVRRTILEDARRYGWQALHRRLAEVDPDSARRIHPNDPQRLQRALEVFAVTGRPMSDLLDDATREPLGCRVIKIIIAPADRDVLKQRIKIRFEAMLAAGLEDEVRGLYERGDLHAGLPSMRMVGYRQVWRYLAGQLDRADMIAHAVVATRQLAKRQMTWFRGETGAGRFDSLDPLLYERVLSYLEQQQTQYRMV
jgi:tRNA dimethylallyltransferase